MRHRIVTLGLLAEAEVTWSAGLFPKLCWAAPIQLRRIYLNASSGCWKGWCLYQLSGVSKLVVHTDRSTVSFGRDNTNRWSLHEASLQGKRQT